MLGQLIPPGITDEQAARVKILRIGARDVVMFMSIQQRLPEYVELSGPCLPPGCIFLSWGVLQNPMAIEVLVHHPDFDPVPYNQNPPMLGMDRMHYHYALATEEEMRARRAKDPVLGQAIANPVKSWREQPPLF